MDAPLLARTALFGGFTDEEIAVVRAYFEEARFAAGQTIVRQGELGDRLFFVLDGEVSVALERLDSAPIPLVDLGKGEVFGEMEIIDIQPRSATVSAKTDVHLLSLRNRALFKLYHQRIDLFARLVMNLAREISRRLRMADGRMAALVAKLPPS